MRKYNPIWKRLKKTLECTVEAHPALHARIIKGVTGEKYRDLAYKLEKTEENKRITLEHSIDGSKIKFFLLEYDRLDNITLTDLGG